MKFTFKTNKPTGRYASFFNSTVDIKLKRKICGKIGYKKPHKIRFMVYKGGDFKDNNKNCDWMWITLARNFESLVESKEWLNENIERLFKQFQIRTE